jgi:hypothetical protein
MNAVITTELRKLVSADNGHSISIYLPVQAAGTDARQDAIRLKNSIVTAEQSLIQHGMSGKEAYEFLRPIIKLPPRTNETQGAQGLAIFHSHTTTVHYYVDIPFDELLIVGCSFHLRPLLPAVCADPEYFVLAFSQNHVRLLKCTLHGFERIELSGLPTNMTRGLNLQGADRGEQVHSGMRGVLGKEAAVFHGQGGHRDTLKGELVEYFRLIEKAMLPTLRRSNWRLILAGVRHEVAILRKTLAYTQIAERELDGCFDHVDDCTLHEKSLPIARCFIEPARGLQKYAEVADTKFASDDVEEILAAAHIGQIDSLIVARCGDVFGRFDAVAKAVKFVTRSDPDLDLVELAIAKTLLHGGSVCASTEDEVPRSGPLRAVLRY